ncbi:glycosyltransferase family 2 protein [Candidatus Atribacteria bacterium HGW-Atribacteria-1]|nr:MAG: glycosyltransferase family 2 protein [Candidatus Atribacteria bacterium HGW-Atribacteria-1]
MNHPKVAIIVLNWNGKQDTIECLESLKQITYSNYEILLVDNGSTDGSVKYFKERYPEIEIIVNEENLGFAEGNNIAMKVALKDKYVKYIALLNNDTKVEPYWLEELVKVAESDERVGSCQSKMLLMSNPMVVDAVGISITRSGGAIQDGYETRDIGQYDQVKEIFGVCAGAALYRREMLTQIGLFDEDFFAYYEDVDLALRARLAGWKSMYVPKAIVYHVHSATFGKNSPFKLYFLTRNEYYYKIKNLPTSILIRFLMIKPIVVALRILGFIKNKEVQLIKPYMRGNFDAFKNIPKMFKKRKKIRSTQIIHDKELRGWFE